MITISLWTDRSRGFIITHVTTINLFIVFTNVVIIIIISMCISHLSELQIQKDGSGPWELWGVQRNDHDNNNNTNIINNTILRYW